MTNEELIAEGRRLAGVAWNTETQVSLLALCDALERSEQQRNAAQRSNTAALIEIARLGAHIQFLEKCNLGWQADVERLREPLEAISALEPDENGFAAPAQARCFRQAHQIARSALRRVQ